MEVKIENAYPVRNEADSGFTVMALDADGRQYYLQDIAVAFDRADRLADKVKERAFINLDLWFCHVPYGTTAWLLDGMEQRQIEDERFGYC